MGYWFETGLNSVFNLFSHLNSASFDASISICLQTAAATSKAQISSGFNFRFFSLSLHTIISSARTNFLSVLVFFICSFTFNFGGGGGRMGGGFKMS